MKTRLFGLDFPPWFVVELPGEDGSHDHRLFRASDFVRARDGSYDFIAACAPTQDQRSVRWSRIAQFVESPALIAPRKRNELDPQPVGGVKQRPCLA